jgi:surfactin synthase thioesterase subunit
MVDRYTRQGAVFQVSLINPFKLRMPESWHFTIMHRPGRASSREPAHLMDAQDMRDTIRVVRLTHANDTPMQAFTIEYDRCLALRAKKHAAAAAN